MSEEQWVRTRKRLQTQDEWFAWDHPILLWRLLSGKASDRKARLFESACLRRLSHWPEVGERLWAVEILERQAEGPVPPDRERAASLALREVRQTATWVMGGMWNQAFDEMEEHEPAPWPTAGRTAEALTIAAGRLARAAAGMEEGRPDDEQRTPEERAQCNMLRCIFSSPFRPPPILSPAWVAGKSGTVIHLAQATYDQRDMPEGTLDRTRLTVLADALEEAGCGNADLLGHLRHQEMVHVRGCWVVDLLLAKE